MNGGIIATLIDCHSVCTAMAAAYFEDARELGSEPAKYLATGRLEIDYRRPAPIDAVLQLEAEIAQRPFAALGNKSNWEPRRPLRRKSN